MLHLCVQKGQESWMQKLQPSSSNRRDSTWQHSLLSWQLGQGLRLLAPGTLMWTALVLEMPGIALRHGWLRSPFFS